MENDLYFPGYHFRPGKNWMNDPNGLIWKDGWYHLFFQYNPWSDIWGDIHWGHARTRDLIHWQMCPIALKPSMEYGEVHCYSGCAVEDGDQVKLFYTSIGVGERGPEHGAQQWSAVNTDSELINWEKSGIPALTQEVNGNVYISMWRDPFIWKDNSLYRLLLSGTCEGKGCIALYESDDLKQWTFRSILYSSNNYELIECPNIMKFGDQYVLLYSPLEAVRYVIGKIDPDTMKLQVEKEGIFDYSVGKKGFYAPNTYLNDPEGRYLVMGCLFEGDRLTSAQKRGWAGMQSLPREVKLKDGNLKIWPAKECRILRKEILAVVKDTEKQIHAEGSQIEVEMSFVPTEETKAELVFLLDPNGTEKTVLTLDYQKGQIYLDRTASTTYEDVTTEDILAPLNLTSEKVILDVFVDHSAIEVYYNQEITISARIFPKSENALHHTVTIYGETVETEGSIYKLEI